MLVYLQNAIYVMCNILIKTQIERSSVYTIIHYNLQYRTIPEPLLWCINEYNLLIYKYDIWYITKII